MDLAPGLLLAGRYRLVRLLGTGGMGQVWAATHTVTGRPFALKLLHTRSGASDEARRRFMREATAATAVNHPNVVEVRDFFELGDGTPLMVMDLLEGESLGQRVHRLGALPVPETCRILLHVVSSVAAAHAIGIVHRDLKPDNVFLSRTPDGDEHVKVLDFGIAKLREDDGPTGEALTAAGTVMGTPQYMAPEQAMGERDIDARSDVWAIGVIAYECLTGRRPIVADTYGQIVRELLQGTIRPVVEVAPDLPADLGALVDRMLVKERSGRLADLREALEPLRRYADVEAPRRSPRDELLARDDVASAATVASSAAASDALVAADTVLGTPGNLVAPPARHVAESTFASARTEGATGPMTRRAPRRWMWLIAASAAVAGVVTIGVVATRRLRSPLASPSTVLACPPLAARGVLAPTGWLGAAAADLACRRAVVHLGGNGSRMLLPAQLLDLPTEVSSAFPVDVYSDGAAIDKARSAATLRGDAWLDGDVSFHDERFDVTLVVRARSGREIERAKADDPILFRAVSRAVAGLVEQGAIPRAKTLDPEVAAWLDTADPDAAVALLDLDSSYQVNMVLPDLLECARVERFRPRYGPSYSLVHAPCEEAAAGDDKVLPAVAVDRTSPAAFARSVPVALRYSNGENLSALADETQALLEHAGTPHARARLAALESFLAYGIGDAPRARVLGLRAVREDPQLEEGWVQVMQGAYLHSGADLAAVALQAWVPGQPNTWNFGSLCAPPADVASRTRLLERATTLSPSQAILDQNLAELLLMTRKEDVRSLAARRASGNATQRMTAETLLVRVEMVEGSFGAALARGRAALANASTIGRFDGSEVILAVQTFLAALVTGRAEEVGNEVATRFVLADPPRLYKRGAYSAYSVVGACAFASRDIGVRCVKRLRELVDSGYFDGAVATTKPLVVGVERMLEGDREGALAALRPLAKGGSPDWLLAYLFERLGADDLAAAVDAPGLARPALPMTSSLGRVREARRAERRGDLPRARELAKQTIDAWSVADVEIPAVAEMRALLARHP